MKLRPREHDLDDPPPRSKTRELVNSSTESDVLPELRLIFSDIYQQKGLWGRLEKIRSRLKYQPDLGKNIYSIHIMLHDYKDVPTLAKHLAPILNMAPNLRILSLPIHPDTIRLLEQSSCFSDLSMTLNVQKEDESYGAIYHLPEFTLQRYSDSRRGCLPLQNINFGACATDERIFETINSCQDLETFTLDKVTVINQTRKSTMTRLLEALESSSGSLIEMILDIDHPYDGNGATSTKITPAVTSLAPFACLKYAMIHEEDLYHCVELPPSLTRLDLLDFGEEPNFSFFKGADPTKLSSGLKVISSYSRQPKSLCEELERLGYYQAQRQFSPEPQATTSPSYEPNGPCYTLSKRKASFEVHIYRHEDFWPNGPSRGFESVS